MKHKLKLPAKQINGKEDTDIDKKNKDLITAAIEKGKKKQPKFNS
jgi:hypothetical protein